MQNGILAVTGNADVVRKLRQAFMDSVQVTNVWPNPSLKATDVLLVDLRVVENSTLQRLQVWSHKRSYASLVLVDNPGISRETIARIWADALLPMEADPLLVVGAVMDHTRVGVFRAAAAEIMGSPSLPYPLVRFLSAALTERRTSVSRLSAAYGFKQPTLRNQWRVHRTDSATRLQDVLRHVARLRAQSGSMTVAELRSQLREYMMTILGSGLHDRRLRAPARTFDTIRDDLLRVHPCPPPQQHGEPPDSVDTKLSPK
jgi:hypothetical protein